MVNNPPVPRPAESNPSHNPDFKTSICSLLQAGHLNAGGGGAFVRRRERTKATSTTTENRMTTAPATDRKMMNKVLMARMWPNDQKLSHASPKGNNNLTLCVNPKMYWAPARRRVSCSKSSKKVRPNLPVNVSVERPRTWAVVGVWFVCR